MSSKRGIRRKAHDDKRAYSTSAAAWKRVRALRQKGEAVRVYKCQFCKQYHIGHFKSEPWIERSI